MQNEHRHYIIKILAAAFLIQNRSLMQKQY